MLLWPGEEFFFAGFSFARGIHSTRRFLHFGYAFGRNDEFVEGPKSRSLRYAAR
jgi:hypothetical protein